MKKLVAIILFGLSVGLLISFSKPTSAFAWSHHYTTPSSLRGNWYAYQGGGQYRTVKIRAHSYQSNGFKLTPYQRGYKRLYVTSYAGRYTFNRANYHYQLTDQFWIGKRRINGRYYRVLKSYYNMGYVMVYLRHPVRHSYSYQE